MKKKFAGILVCMMMLCMGLFAGCSLVEPDYYKYYNQVIAVVKNTNDGDGRTKEITKRDLIEGYQSVGSSYEQYNGATRKEAIDMTIELLANRNITILEAEKKFGLPDKKYGKTLSQKEQTYLYKKTVDALYQNLESYYKDIAKKDEQSSEETKEVKFNGYTKNARVEKIQGKYIIKVENVERDPLYGFIVDPQTNPPKSMFEKKHFDEIYPKFVDYVLKSNDDYKEAFKEYARQLRMSEYGMGLSEKTPDLFKREIWRIYKLAYENYIIEKYNFENKQISEISSISPEEVMQHYSDKVSASYTKYVIEQDSQYDENMQSALKDIYYFKDSVTDPTATEFFTVANVLFKFNDAQKAEYDAIVAEYNKNDGSMSEAEYNNALDVIYSKITPVVRKLNEDTGVYEEVESDLSCREIFDSMKNELAEVKLTNNKNKIGDTINQYIYSYNEDEGMFNAESNYVIGVDKEGKAVSKFVESFTNDGIALYNKGNGEFGDISSDFVRSEFGLHLLIYTGKCENVFDTMNVNDDEAIYKLATTRVNPLVDKTYFDVIYDEIYSNDYQALESSQMNFLRKSYKIKVYVSRFTDLVK